MAINPDIRDQAYQFFIEEAPELLQVIEAGLLNLKAERSTAKIHNLMRAAHSIKGGSASVELEAIATLAHRLENIFRALYNEELEIDTDLESQLLCAYDCLRLPLTEQISTGKIDTEQALASAEPIFSQIEERLGNFLEQADYYIPSSSDLGVNMALSIFEVDVQEGLEHLANVLADPDDYEVAGELRAQAEVFTGFATFLDLPGFGAIASAALCALDTHPDQALEITQLALADFQAGREAVLNADQTQGGSPSAALLALASSESCQNSEFRNQESEFGIQELALPTPHFLLEELFGSPTTFPIDLDVTPTVAVTPTDELSNQPAETDWVLEEAITSSREDQVSYTISPADPNTNVSDLPEVIPGELVAEVPSITEAINERFPLLEEVFGSAAEIPELATSDSSSLVHLPSRSQAIQQQHQEIQETPETLEVAVQSIEQLFESLPFIEETPEVVSGSFVDTPLKRKVRGEQQKTDQSVTPKLTLRVDLDRLERMNNLVGELAINRNSLSLQNDQLQGSVRELLNRFARFHSIVGQLRGLSDQLLVGATVGGRWSEGLKVNNLKVESLKESQQSNNFQLPTFQPYIDKSHFDSLEMDRYGVLHSRLHGILEEMAQLEEAVDDIVLFARATNQTLEQQRQMQIQLRDELMWARMLPLGELLNRFPRLLRDLATNYHKPVNLKLYGTGVLVDRAVLEKLYDPLVHLLRNAFDHGIELPEIRQQLGKSEQGQIEITAYHKGSHTIIEVKDDGRGIQPELIRQRALERGWLTREQLSGLNEAELLELIFEPGFSTANQVTELSGRGVGLDVVRGQLRSLKGTVNLTSSPGLGTTFTLRLPFTLTIAKLLICMVGSSTLALPSDGLEEIVVPKAGQTKQSATKRFLHWREQLVPIYRVADLLDYTCPLPETSLSKALIAVPSPEDWALPMVVIKQGQQAFALEVERLITEQELVIKPFGNAIAPPSYTYGCTILGDGSLIPVIDGTALLERFIGERTMTSVTRTDLNPSVTTRDKNIPTSGNQNHLDQLNPTPPSWSANPSKTAISTVLVVDDAVALRRTLALTLERAGFRVLQARDGREAIAQLQKNPSTNLVICDIEMPNMNGFDFLNYRRQEPQLSKIPVIMLTSRSNNKHRWLAMHLGATDYFTKPYIEQSFLKAIKDIINSH